jgi:hypothetical protein
MVDFCESIHVGEALASIFGAKAPPTINKTMTVRRVVDSPQAIHRNFDR